MNETNDKFVQCMEGLGLKKSKLYLFENAYLVFVHIVYIKSIKSKLNIFVFVYWMELYMTKGTLFKWTSSMFAFIVIMQLKLQTF